MKQACPALKNSGGFEGGGQTSPPFANTMLASWVWKGFIRVEEACPAPNKQEICIVYYEFDIKKQHIYIYALLFRFCYMFKVLYDIVFYSTLCHYNILLYFVLIYTHTHIYIYIYIYIITYDVMLCFLS